MLADYRLHPLLLPEILSRIGLAIPAWEPIIDTENNTSSNHDHVDQFSNSPSTRYRFTPTTLIVCSKVCRTWFSIFYPDLWTVYDGYAMSPLLRSSSSSSSSACNSHDESSTITTTITTRSRRTYWIPDDVVLANSDHIQILLNDHRRLFGRRRYECSKLVDLTIFGSSPGLAHLVRSHGSQLRRLKWVGNVPYSGMLEALDLECLATLTRVEELVLAQWDVSPRELYDVDNNDAGDDGGDGEGEGGMKRGRRGKGLIEVLTQTCSKSLRRLTLQRVQGLEDLPSDSDHYLSSPDDNNTDGNGDSNKSSKGGGVVLEGLEELAVDAEWVENKALIHFLIGQTSTPTTASNNTLSNFCPKLKRLDLGAGLLEDPEMIADLERMLPLAHPGLVRDMSIVESRPWARYHQIRPQVA
ncbi:hypothetical protein BG015_007694 [Linnemannia schmuckeri]|uniref:F-box domain-containing protein n=1 Tax=Linnemannia schmuckeri TaxID=64567 RepID=A0A9P5VB87_9FUNG|nr:hypothetical protein BG015_007694 [Linnemannia schmuckeri]